MMTVMFMITLEAVSRAVTEGKMKKRREGAGENDNDKEVTKASGASILLNLQW